MSLTFLGLFLGHSSHCYSLMSWTPFLRVGSICELLTFQSKCGLLSFKVGLKRCYWGNVPNPRFTMYDRL